MRKIILPLIFAFLALGIAGNGFAAAKAEQSKQPAQTKPAAKAEQQKTADAAKPLVLDMVIGDPEDSEMGVLGIAFKNYVLQASKGRMDVKLSYSGGLDADETFQFHRVQTGKLDMAMGGVGNIVPMISKLGVLTLPYIFPDLEAVVRGTTGKAAELLNSYAEKGGMHILAWSYYGYRYISNSKRPVKKAEDLEGLRIRVPQSLAMIKTYRAYGAIPTPIAWPMTRSALKNDLVDGQCYDYAGFRAMKFHDVGQKFITEVHCFYNIQPLVINEKLFKSLPEADQKILTDAGKHIQDLSMQYQMEMNAMAKKALMAEGVQVSSMSDEEALRDIAISKVWPQAAENVGGREVINEYLKACDLTLWDPAEHVSAADAPKEAAKETAKDAPKN